MPQSRIFQRCRTLGYVSNEIPLQVRYIKRRRDNYITTCVGKSFHTYNASQLALLQISDLHPDQIECIAINYTNTYTACKDVIYVWRNGIELLKKLELNSGSDIKYLLTFGTILVAIDENNLITVWNIDSWTCHSKIPLEDKHFQVTVLMHPATYINKILLGSSQGKMQLWNVNHSTLLFEYKGWDASITCIEQPPALDIVGIGLSNGRIILHNIKYDETLMEFYQDYGSVINLAFRIDGPPMMASSSNQGHIVFWNLEKRNVAHQLLNAHQDSVTGIRFLGNEPLLITSSPDNTLKLWIFDMSDGGPRLLRIREGHSSPPTMIRFYDKDNILSSGNDSTIRMFNLKTERFNKNMGTALFINKAKKKRLKRDEREQYKMPAITQFKMEATREGDWNNLVAIHSDMHMVTTWSTKRLCRGDIDFTYKYFNELENKYGIKSAATCAHLTHCGNFVIIGYSSGYCLKFNIQCGELRGAYGDPKAHKNSINGVAADIINQFVVTGSRKLIRFWLFKCYNSNEYIKEIKMESLISFFRVHKERGLMSVILEDFTIIILDMNSKLVIRNLWGHKAKINDAVFTNDARWLITAGMDSIIKVWDLATSQLIDHFRLGNPCIALDISPQGEYLATAHSHHLGIYLWENKTIVDYVSLRSIPHDAVAPFVDMAESNLLTAGEVDESMDVEDKELNDCDLWKEPEQIDDYRTLSGMPLSKWTALLNTEAIQQRNMAKNVVNKPVDAPFFLPTVSTLKDFHFDVSDNNENSVPDNGQSKILLPTDFENLTDFAKFFRREYHRRNYDAIVQALKVMEPTQIHGEIELLSPEQMGSVDLLKNFLSFLKVIFETRRNFDLANACFGSYLRSHFKFLIRNEELVVILKDIDLTPSDILLHNIDCVRRILKFWSH